MWIVETIMEEDLELTPEMPPPQSTERPAEGSNAQMNEFHEHREQIYVQLEIYVQLGKKTPFPTRRQARTTVF